MKPLDIEAIRKRKSLALSSGRIVVAKGERLSDVLESQQARRDAAKQLISQDIPALIAEVERLREIESAAQSLMAGITWSMLQGKVMSAKLDASAADELPRLARALSGRATAMLGSTLNTEASP